MSTGDHQRLNIAIKSSYPQVREQLLSASFRKSRDLQGDSSASIKARPEVR